jgi:TPR repeat protein
MKLLLTLILVAASLTSKMSQADFNLGLEYYNQKKFDKAFKEFEEASHFADHDAQFNLGVMYLRGEFVPKDLVQAYAWLRMAAQSDTYEQKGTYKKIFEKLDVQKKALAEKFYQQYFAEFSDQTVSEKLQPVLASNKIVKTYRPIKKPIPQYPKKAFLTNNNLGVVDVIFTIDKDGSTRDHVVFGSPSEIFKSVALENLRATVYETAKVNNQPVTANGVRQRFIFSLHDVKLDNKEIKKQIEKLKQQANNDPAATFNYGYYLEMLSYFTKEIEIDENPNQLYLSSAQKGFHAASYLLGNNLLKGNRCEVNYMQSSAWLMKAAQNDLSDAQYLLAMESFSGMQLEKDDDKGFYWLKRAAETSDIARLRLAWILSTHPDSQYRDAQLATSHFEKVNTKHHDKQAIKWQKQAIKDAEKLELPLETVNTQLASYQAKQPWRETP